MNIIELGNGSFDKYKQNDMYYDNVKKVISDNSSSIKQFANHIKADADYIPTSPNKKHYLIKDGESIASVNELMSEASALKTRGFLYILHMDILIFLL